MEFSDNHRLLSLQHNKIPPPYHGWLTYSYDEFPNKKNFVEPRWRPAKSTQFRTGHPIESNLYMAPGSLGNPDRQENVDYQYQKTYLSWNPANTGKVIKYDKVKPYDITKEQ